MSSLRPSWEVSTEGDQGRTSLSPSPKSSSEDWFQPTLLGSTQCQWRKVKPLGVELTRCNNRPPADLGPTQQRRDPSLFSMQLCEDGKTTGTGCTSMEVPGDEVEPMVDARLPAPQATQGRFLRKVDFAERMRDSFVETTVHALRGVELKETCETTVTILWMGPSSQQRRDILALARRGHAGQSCSLDRGVTSQSCGLPFRLTMLPLTLR